MALDSSQPQSAEFPLVAPLATRKAEGAEKGEVQRGVLVIDECQLVGSGSFLNFLRGGMQLSLAVGISFDASNGPSARPLPQCTSG